MKEQKIPLNVIIKTFLFILPYIIVEFTNTILLIIDKSMTNSIGKTAVIIFSSFMTLNWAINTIQVCLGNSHSIVLVRDKKNANTINSSAMFLELTSSIVISFILFIFSKQITYIYTLEENARNILSILLKLKAIQLPLQAIRICSKEHFKDRNQKQNNFYHNINFFFG